MRRWGQPLALRQLPHARSLADALPLGIVTFVLEFYHSLPKEVIFTDDRGCPGELSVVAVARTLPPAAMNDAKRAFLAAYVAGGASAATRTTSGRASPPTTAGCFGCRCRLVGGGAAALRLLARRRVADGISEFGAPAGAALRPEGGMAIAGWRPRRRPYATGARCSRCW